jgi:hypothetical protein
VTALFAQRTKLPQTSGQPKKTTTVTDDPEVDKKKSRSGKGSIFLNDSTRNVYGPNTVLIINEEDLFYNRKKYSPIDTTIVNLHRWGYVQRFNYLYQDLGNIGTALNPLYPVVRNFSGAVSGFNSYRLFFDTEQPRYYDTKSPFTKINVIWGGKGRAMTHIEFSRNINSRWNFGFNYRPILIDKQLQRKRRGDRHVTGHYYDFFTTYKSKDDRYLLLFNFRRTRHRVFENGGVFVNENENLVEYFDKEASPRLVAAETQQFLKNYHFFNQYSLTNAFQIYASLDWNKEANYFFDNYASENKSDTTLFDHWERIKIRKTSTFNLQKTIADTVKANDKLLFNTIQAELGVKGRAAFLFYNVYYKFRSYQTSNKHPNTLMDARTVLDLSPLAGRLDYQNYLNSQPRFSSVNTEHYIGGRLAFDIDSLTRLSGMAEINQLGNYSIDARFTSKLIEASFVQSIARPGVVYQQYRGSHDFWNNSFDNITGLKIEGFLKTPFKKFLLAPGLSYTLLSNYVYFKKGNYQQEQTVLPQQSASVINIANPQVKWAINLTKGIKVSGMVINNLTLSDEEGATSIPDWLATGQISLEDYWFDNNLQIHLGFDVTWRSSYQAMGYDIPISQYYIQNDETVGNALLVDPFINAKIKRGRLFVKYHNLLQIFGNKGYIVTPRYPGQRNILDFGFELLIFD